MFGFVQHKPPWFPWFQQGPFLKQDAFKTPDGSRAKQKWRDVWYLKISLTYLYLTTGASCWWKIVPLLLPGSLSEGPKSRVGRLKTSQILTQTCPPLQCGGHWPVLALRALELAVERAGVGPTGDRRGGGAGLAFQSQVDGGAHAALLQVDALRAALVAQVGRHQQGAGERRLRSEEEKLQGESTPEVEPDFKLSLFEMTSFKMLTSFNPMQQNQHTKFNDKLLVSITVSACCFHWKQNNSLLGRRRTLNSKTFSVL